MMSISRKCDRCGENYKQYGELKPTNMKYSDPNGFSFIYWYEGELKFNNTWGYDLCPKCMEELKRWFEDKNSSVYSFKITSSLPENNISKEIEGQIDIDDIKEEKEVEKDE